MRCDSACVVACAAGVCGVCGACACARLFFPPLGGVALSPLSLACLLVRWPRDTARFSPPSRPLPPQTNPPSARCPPPKQPGSYFTLSLFDKLWRPDITQDDALEMIKKGLEEVRRRLVVAPPKFVVKVVDKDGIREVARL